MHLFSGNVPISSLRTHRPIIAHGSFLWKRWAGILFSYRCMTMTAPTGISTVHGTDRLDGLTHKLYPASPVQILYPFLMSLTLTTWQFKTKQSVRDCKPSPQDYSSAQDTHLAKVSCKSPLRHSVYLWQPLQLWLCRKLDHSQQTLDFQSMLDKCWTRRWSSINPTLGRFLLFVRLCNSNKHRDEVSEAAWNKKRSTISRILNDKSVTLVCRIKQKAVTSSQKGSCVKLTLDADTSPALCHFWSDDLVCREIIHRLELDYT